MLSNGTTSSPDRAPSGAQERVTAESPPVARRGRSRRLGLRGLGSGGRGAGRVEHVATGQAAPGPLPSNDRVEARSATRRRTIGDVSRGSSGSEASAPASAAVSTAGCSTVAGRRGLRRRLGLRLRARFGSGAGAVRAPVPAPARAGGAASAAVGSPTFAPLSPRHCEPCADRDRFAFGHEDLGHRAARRCAAPPSRPCRSTLRTRARRPAPARRPA